MIFTCNLRPICMGVTVTHTNRCWLKMTGAKPWLPRLSARKADIPPCSTPYAWAGLSESTFNWCGWHPFQLKINWNPLLDTNNGQKDTHRPVKTVITDCHRLPLHCRNSSITWSWVVNSISTSLIVPVVRGWTNLLDANFVSHEHFN